MIPPTLGRPPLRLRPKPSITFCQRTLPLDLCGGNADDPDYVEHLLIPCQYGYGHDGKCCFPMPNRTVGR